MKQLDRINRFVNKYLTVFVLLIVAVALVLPGPMSVPGRISFGTLHLAGRSFSFSLTNVMLMIIMFGAGTAVSPEEIGHLVRRPLTLGISVIVKYLAMVFAAFAAARILRLGPELAFGMILLGSMPSGTAAAVLVALAGGEVPFGVALCVISTLIAPIASPLLTLLLGGSWVQVDFASMVLNITLIVLIPVVAGILLKLKFGDRLTNFRRILTSLSLLSVLLIISNSTAPNRDVILSMESVAVCGAITIMYVLGVLLCSAAARVLRMSRPRSYAMIITACEQNSALSVGIAAGLGGSAAVAIPPIIAVALNFILAAILTNILAAGNSGPDTDTEPC
jgi:BASS family bile acid:Na+ symporter